VMWASSHPSQRVVSGNQPVLCFFGQNGLVPCMPAGKKLSQCAHPLMLIASAHEPSGNTSCGFGVHTHRAHNLGAADHLTAVARAVGEAAHHNRRASMVSPLSPLRSGTHGNPMLAIAI